jgi:hypothetical protein
LNRQRQIKTGKGRERQRKAEKGRERQGNKKPARSRLRVDNSRSDIG